MRLSLLPLPLSLALLFQSTVATSSLSSLTPSNPSGGRQDIVGSGQRLVRVKRQDTTAGLPSTGGTGTDTGSDSSSDTSEQPASSAAADPATSQQQATTSQATTPAQTSAVEETTTQQQPTSSTQPPATSQPGKPHSS